MYSSSKKGTLKRISSNPNHPNHPFMRGRLTWAVPVWSSSCRIHRRSPVCRKNAMDLKFGVPRVCVIPYLEGGRCATWQWNKYMYIYIYISSWWLNQPLWKICSSKWVHLPQIGVKIKKMKAPPRFVWQHTSRTYKHGIIPSTFLLGWCICYLLKSEIWRWHRNRLHTICTGQDMTSPHLQK